VLFAGDVVMNTSFVAANATTSSMNAWLAACDAFDAMHPDPRAVHGPIGDGSLVPTLRTVLQAIQARAQARGPTVDESPRRCRWNFR
jgi:hypothetical protein